MNQIIVNSVAFRNLLYNADVEATPLQHMNVVCQNQYFMIDGIKHKITVMAKNGFVAYPTTRQLRAIYRTLALVSEQPVTMIFNDNNIVLKELIF